MSASNVWIAAAAAGVLAFAWAAAVRWCGPVDTIKGRSSHLRPTPTSGGLAIMAATAAGLLLLAQGLAADEREPLAVLLAAAAGLGLFGAADDLLDLPAKGKLALQVVIAIFASCGVAHVTELPLWPGFALTLPSPAGAAGSALFLVVTINSVNFMDGANGLAPGVQAIALAGLAAAAWMGGEPALAGAALAGAAACAGFLPWNVGGRLFQGDAGAFFAGLMIGGLGLALGVWRATTPYFVVFTVLPLLTDVLLTLAARARRGAPLGEAHREHVYQLWLQATGRSHAAVSLRVWGLTAACTVIGLLLERYAPQWAFAGLMATVAVLSLAWWRTRRALLKAGATP